MHLPVPHTALVRSIEQAALGRGFQITRKQFALGNQGRRLFGVMDLIPPEGIKEPEQHGFSIGFRNSTDETLGIRIVAGVRVFVCDNLALSGDLIALKRRNTVGLELDETMADGFDRYVAQAGLLNERVRDLQRDTITDGAASRLLLRLFDGKVLPMRLFHAVIRNYFRPSDDMTDCQPRTLWGLHNSVTRTLKLLSPSSRFMVNVTLGDAFGLNRPADRQ
jgi:hypothetical protein